jgi:hypothetical protein
LIVFAILTFTTLAHEEVRLTLVGARAITVIAFGIGVAWAARQADKHQAEERRCRRMELELAAIQPYLANLPEKDQWEVKKGFADRVFGQRDTSAELLKAQEKTTGSIFDVAAMLAKSLENISKNKT